jgi:hypothetical protein
MAGKCKHWISLAVKLTLANFGKVPKAVSQNVEAHAENSLSCNQLGNAMSYAHTTRLRPCCLAWYRAASACAIRASTLQAVPCRPASPMLVVIGMRLS